MSKIAGGLEALKDRSARLVSQREAARIALDKAKAQVQTHLLEGDDDDKTRGTLQAKVNDAFSMLESLDAAVTEQARRVAAAEQALNAEQQTAARKVASEALAADVAKIEQQIAPWLVSTRQLASSLAKFEAFRFEAGSIAKYLANAANEIELALSVTVPDLRGGVAAVLEGREKAPSQPAPVVKFVAPKAPPTKTVFFLRASKWTDEKGKLCLIQKFNDATLPLSLAAHAIKVNAAVEMTDPVRKPNLGVWNGRPLHAEHCFALDAASETRASVLHSAFEPHPTRPNHGMMPEQRAPTPMSAAARTLPPGKK